MVEVKVGAIAPTIHTTARTSQAFAVVPPISRSSRFSSLPRAIAL
ncbi:hypothetical protein [Oculatella sp. FACHB-28]|nr:hypothetical protein [Oculatella sp. FACHB-28]